jgi:hypothetical protein
MVFEVCSSTHAQMVEPYIWGSHVGSVLSTGKRGDEKEMFTGRREVSFHLLV